MARGRMINKKISNSKRVNDMPLQAQLLFTWLIPHLDCNGCFYGSAQMIKSLVVPRKNWSKNQIEKWLVMMENSKKLENKSENSNQNGHSFLRNSKVDECTPLIFRYTLDGEQYLFMPGFVGEQIGLRYDKEKAEFPTFDGKITESSRKKSPLRGREGKGNGTQHNTTHYTPNNTTQHTQDYTSHHITTTQSTRHTTKSHTLTLRLIHPPYIFGIFGKGWGDVRSE